MDESKKEAAQPTPQIPVEEADIKERIEGFNKEILPLLGKYELGLAAMPRITADGRTVADPIIVSVRKTLEAEKKAADVPAAAVDAKKNKESGLAAA
jgi:hypothetical protein